MQVRTDHQILAFGDNNMQLFDTDGTPVVTASREHDRAPWTLHTERVHATTGMDVEDKMVHNDEGASPRGGVLTAMTEMALAVLPEDGYSTLVPHGITEMP